MKISTKVVYDMNSWDPKTGHMDVIEEVSYEYKGPIAHCSGGGDGGGGGGGDWGLSDVEKDIESDIFGSNTNAPTSESRGGFSLSDPVGSLSDVSAAGGNIGSRGQNPESRSNPTVEAFVDKGISRQNAIDLAVMGPQAAADVLGTSTEATDFIAAGVSTAELPGFGAPQGAQGQSVTSKDTGQAMMKGAKTGSTITSALGMGPVLGGIIGAGYGLLSSMYGGQSGNLAGEFGMSLGDVAEAFGGEGGTGDVVGIPYEGEERPHPDGEVGIGPFEQIQTEETPTETPTETPPATEPTTSPVQDYLDDLRRRRDERYGYFDTRVFEAGENPFVHIPTAWGEGGAGVLPTEEEDIEYIFG